jgi:hypothetical protein
MQTFFNQIRVALAANLYYLSLYVCLTIPDICSAMSSENGWATDDKYIAWFDQYVGPKYSGGLTSFTGNDCYAFRCSLLHQGSTQHPKGRYKRIIFVEPGATGSILHRNIINDAMNLDLPIFCKDILDGADAWLKQAEQTPEYQKNYPTFAQRYPNGLSPYIGGVPVIS